MTVGEASSSSEDKSIFDVSRYGVALEFLGRTSLVDFLTAGRSKSGGDDFLDNGFSKAVNAAMPLGTLMRRAYVTCKSNLG